MFKICLTGGPGSGKTVMYNHLAQVLEERGYFVFLVPETEPELKMNGIRPNSHISQVAFQNFVLNKQLEKERLYNNLAQYYPTERIVVVYDRGIMDVGVSLEKAMFEGMLKKRGLSVSDALDHYDIVIHMVTAAEGAEAYYKWNDPTKENLFSNLAREIPAEAIEKDKKTRELWEAHPNRHIIHSFDRFADKVRYVTELVFRSLGEPIPIKNTKKWIIKKPTEHEMAHMHLVFSTYVIQTYLKSNDKKIDRRVVQRGTKEEGFTFYYIEKVDIGEDEKFVTNKQISYTQYINYLTEADHSIEPVAKLRKCFVHENRYFEIDLYPFEIDYAVLEIAQDINDVSSFLPFTIINDVTNNPNFTSRALAKKKELPVQHKPHTNISIWTYEVGREEKGGKYGSSFFNVETVINEARAIKMLCEKNRNYLVRYRNVDGVRQHQRYDRHSHVWVDD